MNYSPDGKTLASTSNDETIRTWDASSGELQQIFKGHTSKVFSVAYSPDSKVLASVSGDQTIRIWNANSGQLKQTLKGHTGRVFSAAYRPDGKVIASASDDQTVRLWDANSGQLIQTLHGHTNWVLSVTYSPDNKVIVSTSKDGTIRLWDHNQFTTLKLFYDFDPQQVSDALKFLWELGLDKDRFEFVYQIRTPTLYPKQGYYYEDVQFLPLLDMPRGDESKMDQLVRFLESRCAYKDKVRAKSCKNKPAQSLHKPQSG